MFSALSQLGQTRVNYCLHVSLFACGAFLQTKKRKSEPAFSFMASRGRHWRFESLIVCLPMKQMNQHFSWFYDLSKQFPNNFMILICCFYFIWIVFSKLRPFFERVFQWAGLRLAGKLTPPSRFTRERTSCTFVPISLEHRLHRKQP